MNERAALRVGTRQPTFGKEALQASVICQLMEGYVQAIGQANQGPNNAITSVIKQAQNDTHELSGAAGPKRENKITRGMSMGPSKPQAPSMSGQKHEYVPH